MKEWKEVSEDYVAAAVKDHWTQEMIYIDGEAALSCYVLD